MMELVLTEKIGDLLRGSLLGGDSEACAVLIASAATRTDGTSRLLAREAIVASPSDYMRRGLTEAALTPAFVARVTKRAKLAGASMVFVHSHPGNEHPTFSFIDDAGETALAKFLSIRIPDRTHVAMVISFGGVRARHLGGSTEFRVVEIGNNRRELFNPAIGEAETQETFDRQVRAFGIEGQRSLQSLRIAIVGLGGTGSIAAQQLSYLGVTKFILIDPDVIETTNLNRVVGANAGDIGQTKTQVAARTIRGVSPLAEIDCQDGDITRELFARRLLEADLILGCTDSHGSRAVLQQVAYQYLIPCIDMGSVIAVREHAISHIIGRVQLLSPGHACLTCSGLLNANAVRKDMMSEFERQADPYFSGAAEPAPAVISLNGTVVSLAVTMLLAMTTGIPSAGRHVLYNAVTSTLRTVRGEPSPECFVCSPAGCLARGDDWPLNVRRD